MGVFLSSPRFSVRAYSYRFISKPGFIGGSVHRSSCLSFLTARLGPPVHGASALRPRHRHRRAVRWRSDDPPPPPRPCRRPRTARRAMFFTGAPGRNCKLLLPARCSLVGGNKSSSGSRARGRKRCGRNYFFDYHRASDPTRALLQHLHCCCSMPAPCTLPGDNMDTRRAPTATSAYQSNLWSAVAPSTHPPAKFAAGRAAVSA